MGAATEAAPRHRGVNEDAWATVAMRSGLLVVVADGMGGRERGAQAARVAVAAVQNAMARAKGHHTPSHIRGALYHAHERVLFAGRRAQAGRRMGTTCAIAFVEENCLYVGHTGDSRVYRVRQTGGIARLTRDLSLRDDADPGERAPEEDDAFAGRVLKGFLGQAGPLKAVVPRNPLPLDPGDCVVVCTDGVHDVLDDAQIESIVNELSPQEAADELVRRARAAGSDDDITAVVVATGPAEAGRTPPSSGALRARGGAAATDETAAPRQPIAAARPHVRVARRRPTRRWALAGLATLVLVAAVLAFLWWRPTPRTPEPLPPAVRAGPAVAQARAPGHEPAVTPPPTPTAPSLAPADSPKGTATSESGGRNGSSPARRAGESTRGTGPAPTSKATPGEHAEREPTAALAHETAAAGATNGSSNEAEEPPLPTKQEVLDELRAMLREQNLTSREIFAVLRGQLRKTLLQRNQPASLPPADELGKPLDALFAPYSPEVLARASARRTEARRRAALLWRHLARLLAARNTSELRVLEAQLTYREKDPWVQEALAAMLEHFDLPLIVQDWARLHLQR